eukprot:scaffold98101_cov73-Attheya_sp.AAC.1
MVWQGAQILKSLTSTSEASHLPQASMTAPPATIVNETTAQESTPKKHKGGRKGRKSGAGVWGEAETDLAFNIIEVLLPTGDEAWEEAAVEFYNKGKDRGYNRTGSAIRAHFHKLAFASAPTGRTVCLVQRAKDIKRDIDKEEPFVKVTSENRSGMTGTNLVDDNGEVRRAQPRNRTAEVADVIKELGHQNLEAANAISESVALQSEESIGQSLHSLWLRVKRVWNFRHKLAWTAGPAF